MLEVFSFVTLLATSLYFKYRFDNIEKVLTGISQGQEKLLEDKVGFEQDLNTRLESLQSMRFSPLSFRQGLRRNLKNE